MTRLAVELTLLPFVRSSKMRFVRWGEVNLDQGMWTIPGRREPIPGIKHSEHVMKMTTEHVVYLCRQAIDVSRQLHELNGRGDVIFTCDHHNSKVMSENTINNALRKIGYDTRTDVCGHGFRTMARDAFGESRLWNDDVIARQPGHVERENVKASYLHTSEYIDAHSLMLQGWADYLDASREQSLSPFSFARIHGIEQVQL